ncbi:MAG TPA: glycerol-3-phosphate 1-O-acyltransferase PlsY [Thermoanaerobaculia bacterium]|jgi:glycerol-3-phosphate acyltransferase PlsY|nr:glycerol-3-phosphate 1-O-acyltransferase PlsY [Thermoanaerobaculia bacterium]
MLPGLVVVLAYLIGSIPFSFLVVKLVAGKDVREHGSQNVGATNVARTAGKIPGIIALLLDIAKGYCAVVIAWTIVRSAAWPFEPGIRPWESVAMWTALAGLIAVLGHMFPVWLRFHGGKGVATATGVFLALDPIAVAGALIVFAIVLLASRYVSLASILSSASIPLFFHYLLHEPFWYVAISIGISIIVILKHHSNIARLVQGTERKLGQKKESQ